MAYDMNRRIIKDDGSLPHFARASQNIAAAVALLQGLPKPTTPEDHRTHHEIRTLLECAVVQQAESSLSRRRELDTSQRMPSMCPARDTLVHQAPQGGRQRTAVPVHQHLSRNRDARDTLDAAQMYP